MIAVPPAMGWEERHPAENKPRTRTTPRNKHASLFMERKSNVRTERCERPSAYVLGTEVARPHSLR